MTSNSKIYVIGAIILSVLNSGCATPGAAMGAGAGTGILLGSGVGALADPGKTGENRFRNVLIGTAAGGVLGAGTGYVSHQVVKEEKDEAYKKGKAEALKEISNNSTSLVGNAPNLIPPKTEARWIPDQVRGSTFIPGHFEYLILQGARWEVER
jgi:hypothetical protein